MYRRILLHLAGVALLGCSYQGDAAERGRAVDIDLLAGAAVQYSTDGGMTFSAEPPSIAPRDRATVTIGFEFNGAASPTGTDDFASLTLSHDVTTGLRSLRVILNGRDVALPLEGMLYRSVPGIDPDWLAPDTNRLIVELEVRNASRDSARLFAPTITLAALNPSELEFETGPLLGAFDEEFFALTARTNMPATVAVYRLEAEQLPETFAAQEPLAQTRLGLLHRLRVPRSRPVVLGSYAVVAKRDGSYASRIIEPPGAPQGGFRFVALGDSRTNIEDWRTVATAVAGLDPHLVIHVGDIVTDGRRDWEWDAQFWDPGEVLLAATPAYLVIGNHEQNAALFDELAFAPSRDGRARNWAQELGGVLLIGIDGGQDWSAGGNNAGWLEEILSGSDARFTFLFNHYPGWSSANHGRVDEQGHPVERPAREARETVIPLLSRYGATAFVAGHDHAYERSELPAGLTAITCGGGGAPLYRPTEQAEIQNPYSQVFFDRHHFCLFDVESDKITLRALTPAGELLDAREWGAREPD
ncbi:MAG: metallophosphoesterase [Gemmatimonadales bacterium]|jgi:hypothetical protein